MTKTLLTFAFAMVCIYTYGQNYIHPNGDVGIGTTDPTEKLVVNG